MVPQPHEIQAHQGAPVPQLCQGWEQRMLWGNREDKQSQELKPSSTPYPNYRGCSGTPSHNLSREEDLAEDLVKGLAPLLGATV